MADDAGRRITERGAPEETPSGEARRTEEPRNAAVSGTGGDGAAAAPVPEGAGAGKPDSAPPHAEAGDAGPAQEHAETEPSHSGPKDAQTPEETETNREPPEAAADGVNSRPGLARPVLPPEAQEKIAGLKRTAALWKNRPIPPEPRRDRSEESRAAELECGNLYAAGAGVRGRKHVHGGTDCDDWFELDKWEEEGIVLAAVSDGAGSRKFSRVGAKISCRAALESLKAGFQWLAEDPERRAALHAPGGRFGPDGADSEVLRNLAAAAMEHSRGQMYRALEERIGQPGYEALREYRDLSATLLLCVLIPLDNGKYRIVSSQVGDGALALIDSRAPFEKALTVLGSPDKGDYAGETEFLTSASMSERGNLAARAQVLDASFDTLLVMTDGVADDYFPPEPEMLRLYCDLEANGILPLRRSGAEPPPCPEPLAFPLPGTQEGGPETAVQYAWLIESAAGRDLKSLWEDASPVQEAFRLMPPEALPKTTPERLARWLAHYVESTSFDDRTLVAVRRERGGADDGG